jgi:FKBP-type peptidyl-prolyl cis-trans isomerase
MARQFQFRKAEPMKLSCLSTVVCLAVLASAVRAEDTEKVQAASALGVMLGAQIKGLANDLDMDMVIKTAFDFASGNGQPMSLEDKAKISPRMVEIRTNRLQGKADETPLNAEEKAKMALLTGENLSSFLITFKDEIDPEELKKAILGAAKGEPPALNKEKRDEALQKAFARVIDRNKKDGEAYLAENKKKEGVVTTASGLQYKILTAGNGPKPGSKDTVTTHYVGTFVNGRKFDSSYDRKEPTSFKVDKVIKGWTEALQLMPEGSKWQLVIPSDLAYGAGRPGIPPLSTLVFDIELLKVIKAEAPATTPTTTPTTTATTTPAAK